MKAIVMNYRGSHKTQNAKQMIIQPEGSKSKEDAKKLVGKKVVWTSKTGNEIIGTVSAPHGCKGALRVIFPDKGLPGQSLSTTVQIK